jgi:mannose-6-phosphate isomerase-like protein (cupin superfamily)
MGKTLSNISEGKNYTVGALGSLSAENLTGYTFPNPADGTPIPGKVFLAEQLKASGMEVSFQIMPPDMGMPFVHKHRKNEEMYIVLKGSGEFRIDGDSVAIGEGSVIRIAPDGARSWKNTGSGAMIMLCVQGLAGTLTAFTGHDGYVS